MVILFHISTLDINKPLNIEDYKSLRAQLKSGALKNIYKSFPVVLAYFLFLVYGGKVSHSIDDWINSLFTIQLANYLAFMAFNIVLVLGFAIVAIIFWIALKTLAEMDVSVDELKSLQERVHVSGDKVCAKYLVDVHDMGRRLLSCEKKMILKRLEELKKEEEIKNLRGML